jgi:hypothetical protein
VTSITEALTSFTNPKDAEQLQKLDALISQVMPEECGEEELRSLFNVFERFPEEDGYGVFWSILHLLEACNGCDEALIKSVKRKPVEFNIRMVNRLLNSGTNMVGGESLIELLSTVAEAADVLPSVRESANTFLGHQNAHGTQ